MYCVPKNRSWAKATGFCDRNSKFIPAACTAHRLVNHMFSIKGNLDAALKSTKILAQGVLTVICYRGNTARRDASIPTAQRHKLADGRREVILVI